MPRPCGDVSSPASPREAMPETPSDKTANTLFMEYTMVALHALQRFNVDGWWWKQSDSTIVGLASTPELDGTTTVCEITLRIPALYSTSLDFVEYSMIGQMRVSRK